MFPLPSKRASSWAYYVVPADYPEGNQVSVYTDEGLSEEAFGAFQSLLRTNLVAGQPPEIARRVVAGSEQLVRLSDGREIGTEFNVGYLVPVLATHSSPRQPFVFLGLFPSLSPTIAPPLIRALLAPDSGYTFP